MAGALRAIRAGDPFGIWALCTATAAHGVVHAVGPWHGKVPLGGAALASGATLRRMALLTVGSSLAQSVFSMVLVGGIRVGLGGATRDLVRLTEAWLAPASALAVSAVGLVLMMRGIHGWPGRNAHHHHHAKSECGCGHSNGPSVAEVQSLGSTREIRALIASIALRPCTGALFVLVIALGMGVFWVGCVAVLAVGLGTAAFNLIVAGSGVAARRLVDMKRQGRGFNRYRPDCMWPGVASLR